MKVLYLLRYFPTLTETFIYSEISGLLQKGMKVEILALGVRDDGQRHDNLPSCPVHYVPRSRHRRLFPTRTDGEQWLLQFQRKKDVVRLKWMTNVAKSFDHIHVHFAGEAAEIAYAIHLDCGINYSVTTHAVDIFSPRPAWKNVLLHAKKVISISIHNQQFLLRNGIESVHIPCGIPLKEWPVLSTDNAPLKALFIGRDVPKKGLDILLEAWNYLPRECTLRVVSDRTAEDTPQVQFFPLQKREKLRAHLFWCNIVTVPCRVAPNGDRDGIPVVLMEALASGKAVVTTDLPGISELVTANVGWVAKSNCVFSLRDCLTVANDPSERKIRAARARIHIEKSPFVLKKQIYSLCELLVTET